MAILSCFHRFHVKKRVDKICLNCFYASLCMKHCSHSVLNFLDHCWAFTVFDRNRLAKLLRQVGIQICQWILCGLSRPQVKANLTTRCSCKCCWDIGTLQIKVVTICTIFVDHSAGTYLQLPLPFSAVQLKGKHCRKLHFYNGVVDTFVQCLMPPFW